MSIFDFFSEEDPEVKRFKVWLGVGIVWLVLGVTSCDQINFAMRGQRVTAQLINGGDTRGMKRGRTLVYRYREPTTNQQQKKVVEVEGNSGPFASAPAQIDLLYLPGSGGRTIAADSSMMPAYLFGGMTLLGLGMAGYMAFAGRR